MNDRIAIFDQVWNHVNEHFYDPDFNGIDWQQKRIDYKPRIEDCEDIDSLLEILNTMLFELNSSHCGVGLLSELEKAVSPYIFSNGETGIDIRIIEDQIVITHVSANSPADKAGIKTGFVIQEIDGLTLSDIEKRVKYKPPYNLRNQKFHLTSEVLRNIFGKADSEVEIIYLDHNDGRQVANLVRSERPNGISLGGGLPPGYFTSQSYLISDDIGYLSLNAFNPPDMQHVLANFEKIDAAKGIIIDLRGNDGGSVEGMKLLLGRLVSSSKTYGAFINRNERNEDSIVPVGEKYEGRVVVMVDEMSISAAENMAGIIQQLNIGKVIGCQTPGQLLWGNGYLINDSIALVLPVYKLEYLDGYNPEDKGIVPDIAVELSREDLLNRRDSQLESAINYLKEIIN